MIDSQHTTTKGKIMSKLSTRGMAVQGAIANRIPFRTNGALSAQQVPAGWPLPFGTVLPNEYRGKFYDEDPSYVVLSYSTPIAWWSEDHGWTIPAVKYSATTSKHQSQVRIATAL